MFVWNRFEFDRETASGGAGSVLSGSVAYDVTKFARLREDLEAPYVRANGASTLPRPGVQQRVGPVPGPQSRGGQSGVFQKNTQKRPLEAHSDTTQQAANGAFQKSRAQTLRADAYSEPMQSPSVSSDVTISVSSQQHTYNSGDTDITVSNLLSLQSQLPSTQAQGRPAGPGIGQRVIAPPNAQGGPLGARVIEAPAPEQQRNGGPQFQTILGPSGLQSSSASSIPALGGAESTRLNPNEFQNGPTYQNRRTSEPAPMSPHIYLLPSTTGDPVGPSPGPDGTLIQNGLGAAVHPPSSVRSLKIPRQLEMAPGSATASARVSPRRSVSPTSTVSTDSMGAFERNSGDERDTDHFANTTRSAATVVNGSISLRVRIHAYCTSTAQLNTLWLMPESN